MPFDRSRALVLTAVGSLFLAACSSSAGTGAGQNAAATAKPVSGGSLTYAVDTEPVSFDIHASPQDITGNIQRNVFDSLVYQDAKGTFHPWLAKKWTVSGDLKTFTFHLRDDVTFHDGTPFNAEAVKANFDRIVAPATKSQYAASLLGPYKGTTVVDDHTVKVTFSSPVASFLQAASTPYLGFYSPAAIKKYGGKLSAGGAADVGTGPFKFTSYTKGQSVTLTRNPDYKWAPDTAAHQGAAYLQTLTIRFLSQDATRVGALTSGQVQAADPIPPADVKTLKANQSLQAITTDAPGANYALVLNTTQKPLDDINVRRAIQSGIDIDTAVKSVYFGVYKRAWSPISPSTQFYDKSTENSWGYDPDKANAYLDKAGWTGRDSEGYRTKDGKRLSIEWPLMPQEYIREQRDTLGQAIQADLKKIGVEIKRPRLDIGTYIQKVYGGKEGIADYSWARNDADVLRLYFNSASSPLKGGQNATFYKDADIDKWTEQAQATLDATTRAKLYAETQKKVIDLATEIPLYVRTATLGVSAKVHGLKTDPNTWANFYDAWIAK
ncbi:ABC transporter substrate-binding protein [Streptomyces sp. NPDC090088]|uniref:ABC transporter substrate-binding protein n=1 Tax=Streptomyces sp. NPDC090088 TaxID=3365944 RepID=UPI00381A27FB